ncbi:MAG: ComF family protein [Actinomycetota bacterium]|nr:ComF family protein [Actinomycetota bacterium]
MLSTLADLVLPRTCVGCGASDGPLCVRCVGLELLRADGDPPVAAAGAYDATLRKALLAYKERDRRDLARALGGQLARAVRVYPACVLVPVPSSAAARRLRGGDHILRLARIAARDARTSVATPLCLVRRVRDSAGLDPAARAANLAGAMVARRSAGTPAVIVDDIATTGSTLREAARALREAGWEVRGAAVVAATRRRSMPASAGGPPRTGLAWESPEA